MSEETTGMMIQAVEAVVFAADVPVSLEALRRTISDVSGVNVEIETIEEVISELNSLYESNGRAIRIHNWGGGYRMATVEDVAPYVKTHLHHEEERRLSRALLETLSVIAYKQPVSKPEIDHVRGVQSDYAIGQLMERDFVTILGRADSVGRPLLYGTTEHFLEQFGLSALDELPRPREIEDLLNDPAFSSERALITAQIEISGEQQSAGIDEATTDEPTTQTSPDVGQAHLEVNGSEHG